MKSQEKKSESVSVLSSACAQNLPLDLRILQDRSKEEYRSRFLSINESRRRPALVIEAPTSKGGVVPIRSGSAVRVFFSEGERSLTFHSQVVGRGKFRLNPRVTVPSLELLVPEAVSSADKRNFYRIPVGDIELSLGIFAQTRGRRDRIRAREKALLTDLGGGGLGFRIQEGKSLLLDTGSRLLLSFRLPNDDEPVRLLGRICFNIRRPELREAFFGVQFVDIDSDLEYKTGVDRILRFVAKHQRKNLGGRIILSR